MLHSSPCWHHSSPVTFCPVCGVWNTVVCLCSYLCLNGYSWWGVCTRFMWLSHVCVAFICVTSSRFESSFPTCIAVHQVSSILFMFVPLCPAFLSMCIIFRRLPLVTKTFSCLFAFRILHFVYHHVPLFEQSLCLYCAPVDITILSVCITLSSVFVALVSVHITVYSVYMALLALCYSLSSSCVLVLPLFHFLPSLRRCPSLYAVSAILESRLKWWNYSKWT